SAVSPTQRTAREATVWHWREEIQVHSLPRNKALRIESREPFLLHFGVDGWRRTEDRQAQAAPFGLWSVLIEPEKLQAASELNFVRRYDFGWGATPPPP